MAVRDFEAFTRQRMAAFDPNANVEPGSPFDVQVIQPLVRRIGTDPFTVDIETFLSERIGQAFPELATKEGDALTDVLIKPLSLLWDPLIREIKRVRLGLSFKDPSVLTVEEAEALGGNLFADRRTGNLSRGPARIFFNQAQNVAISPINFVTSKGGLHFFPREIQSIRTEEMLQNLSADGLYYFDINVVAETEGTEYNIEPNALVSIAELPSAVRVTNTRRYSGGEAADTAQEFVDRAKGELTERSLVTLRGVSSKLINAFPEITRLNAVGFNDPEMNRDIIKGGGLGPVLAAGVLGFVDADGEGQPGSRRFSTTEVDFLTLIGPSNVEPTGFVLTVFNSTLPAFPDVSGVADLDIIRVVGTTGPVSSIDVEQQALTIGTTAIFWTIRKKELTISAIPGGILFPEGPNGEITVPDGQVHVGGATDMHVRGSAFDESTLVIDNATDDVPELAGAQATVFVSGPDNLVRLSDEQLGVDYNPADSDYDIFLRAGERGTSLQLVDGPNAGVYRIVSVSQLPTGAELLLNPQPATVDAANRRWKVFNEVNIDLVDPKETKDTGDDMVTVQGSDLVTTASGVNWVALGVVQKDIVRILNGPDAGDYKVVVTPTIPVDQLQVDRVLTQSTANLQYIVFRPNVAGGLNLPLIRLTKLEILDSASQPLGSIIPYAKPVDVQSRAFQNPSRGVKHTFDDVRLGVVSQQVGVNATGSIITVAAALLFNGETFTLNDGANPATVFEFRHTGTPTPGNIKVDLAGLTTATEVRDEIIATINGVGSGLRIKAYVSGAAIVGLTNKIPGTVGNVAIAETVADVGFIVAGMSGGVDSVYAVGSGTLIINIIDVSGLLLVPTITVTFSAATLSLAAVIAEINSDVTAATAGVVNNIAVQVGADRFGLRPIYNGVYISGGTSLNALFGNNEMQSVWDVRSDTVDELGGWGLLRPMLDLPTGLDVVQVIDGNQSGYRTRGPLFTNQLITGSALDPSTALSIFDVNNPLYNARMPKLAPETDVRIQVGSRSIGSARCYFLDPTSIELDQESTFSVELAGGTASFFPDPTLARTLIPAAPGGDKPKDGYGDGTTGFNTTFTSPSQDFILTGIKPGDELIIDYIPITGTAVLPDPVPAVAGKTVVFSLAEGQNQTVTFIKDDVSLAPGEVTLAGVIDQLNAVMGNNIAKLTGGNQIEFETENSLIIRKTGTANGILLGFRLGLPLTAPHSFTANDQDNDSPHFSRQLITAVTSPTTLTISPGLPSNEDFTPPVLRQQFHVERLGSQRICTTQMVENVAEAGLYYFDVELVSVGSGDFWNIDSALQLQAEGYKSDGWFMTTTDSNLTFSEVEEPKLVISKTILEQGVDDDPSNATQIVGQNIQITYDRSQLTEDVNTFVGSDLERTICQSPLARHLIPHFVRFDLTYIGGSSEEVVKSDIEQYINERFPADPLEVSDIEKIVSDEGATSIRNPVSLIAIVHHVDRTIQAARSQDSLTTGRLAAFVPDVLNISRNVS